MSECNYYFVAKSGSYKTFVHCKNVEWQMKCEGWEEVRHQDKYVDHEKCIFEIIGSEIVQRGVGQDARSVDCLAKLHHSFQTFAQTEQR